MCVCVHGCVCVSERERERERKIVGELDPTESCSSRPLQSIFVSRITQIKKVESFCLTFKKKAPFSNLFSS